MEALDDQDRFYEALQRAFAATSPAVRAAYFELATLYREKLGDTLKMNPSPELMRRIAVAAKVKKAA